MQSSSDTSGEGEPLGSFAEEFSKALRKRWEETNGPVDLNLYPAYFAPQPVHDLWFELDPVGYLDSQPPYIRDFCRSLCDGRIRSGRPLEGMTAPFVEEFAHFKRNDPYHTMKSPEDPQVRAPLAVHNLWFALDPEGYTKAMPELFRKSLLRDREDQARNGTWKKGIKSDLVAAITERQRKPR